MGFDNEIIFYCDEFNLFWQGQVNGPGYDMYFN